MNRIILKILFIIIAVYSIVNISIRASKIKDENIGLLIILISFILIYFVARKLFKENH